MTHPLQTLCIFIASWLPLPVFTRGLQDIVLFTPGHSELGTTRAGQARFFFFFFLTVQRVNCLIMSKVWTGSAFAS